MSAGGIVPGEIIAGDGDIEINPGRTLRGLTVRNTGDRPVQVGSHYHFAEANAALDFDRDAAWGHRLAVPAGTSVRFEPGMPRDVTLVALGGNRVVPGLRGLAGGPLDPSPREDIEPAGSLDSPADEDPAAFTGTSTGARRAGLPDAGPAMNGAEPDELAGEELPSRTDLPPDDSADPTGGGSTDPTGGDSADPTGGGSTDRPGGGTDLTGGDGGDLPENGSPR